MLRQNEKAECRMNYKNLVTRAKVTLGVPREIAARMKELCTHVIGCVNNIITFSMLLSLLFLFLFLAIFREGMAPGLESSYPDCVVALVQRYPENVSVLREKKREKSRLMRAHGMVTLSRSLVRGKPK